MRYFGFLFIALLSSAPVFAADFDCGDTRLTDPSITFEQATDLYGEAFASGNEACAIAATMKLEVGLLELNDGDPEHFQQYIAAMGYLGQTKKLSKEAKVKIGSNLEVLFYDAGFLSYFLKQQAAIEDESAFYATVTLLSLTGAGMGGEWLMRSVFSFVLENSPTRIARAAGLRGLRRVGEAFLESPPLPRLQPRLVARGLGGTTRELQDKPKKVVILDLKYSPMHLAGLNDVNETSLSYFTFWQTFTQQSLKWIGAAAAGFGTGVSVGHFTHGFYKKIGLSTRVKTTLKQIELVSKAAAAIRARAFTSHAADMVVGALEPGALIASSLATYFALSGIDKYIAKLKLDNVKEALEELKARVQIFHAEGTAHSDFETYMSANLIVDHVRFVEAMMVAGELQNQLDISNRYVAMAATQPICDEIKGRKFNLATVRAGALDVLNSTLTYANITAKPKFDQVQALYDENLKFLGSLRGRDGKLEPYLQSAVIRLASMKEESAASLDTPTRVEILQITAIGLYNEYKDRLATDPIAVENELNCHKPPAYLNDPQYTFPF
jgi:hypothetical protein